MATDTLLGVKNPQKMSREHLDAKKTLRRITRLANADTSGSETF
jgi:hypothetical protein